MYFFQGEYSLVAFDDSLGHTTPAEKFWLRLKDATNPTGFASFELGHTDENEDSKVFTGSCLTLLKDDKAVLTLEDAFEKPEFIRLKMKVEKVEMTDGITGTTIRQAQTMFFAVTLQRDLSRHIVPRVIAAFSGRIFGFHGMSSFVSIFSTIAD